LTFFSFLLLIAFSYLVFFCCFWYDNIFVFFKYAFAFIFLKDGGSDRNLRQAPNLKLQDLTHSSDKENGGGDVDKHLVREMTDQLSLCLQNCLKSIRIFLTRPTRNESGHISTRLWSAVKTLETNCCCAANIINYSIKYEGQQQKTWAVLFHFSSYYLELGDGLQTRWVCKEH
jgi:hypothetical protein